MTCDPQTLSQQSSCLRCLTDAQLMIARTYLLCQWANKTGASTPGAPSNPDIALTSASDNIIFTWANGSPVGTTNEIWKSTDGVTFNLFATVAGGIIQKVDNTVMGVGDIWYYKVRSCNGASCSAFSSSVSVSNNYTSANLASISFPTLVRGFGFFRATGLAALGSISLPSLKSIEDRLELQSNPLLTSITLPSLQSLGNFIAFDSCATLSSVSLPNLTLISGFGGVFAISGFSCPALTTFSAPQMMIADNGLIVSFDSDSLNAASVNQILARCVASGFSGGSDIELNSPGNAAPSGQGVADKATLIGNGNTVNTN